MRSSILSLLLSAPALAQGVPHGDAIVSVFGNIAPSEGLWLLDRAGACSAVTGLVAAGSAGSGVNSVQLDPIDDRVWLGGIDSNGNTNGQVNWIRLSPTASVSQFRQHGATGIASSVSGIAFDDDGNPIVSSGRAASGGGIFRIDRHGGLSTRIAAVANGLHNAICRDPAGNLYLGMFDASAANGGGAIYRMAVNPDCSYQAPALLGTVPMPQVSGIDWCPDPANGGNHRLLVSSWGGPAAALFELPASGGAATAVSGLGQLNWVEYDARQDDFLACDDGSGPSFVFQLSRDYANNRVFCAPQGGNAGILSAIDTSDATDADIVAVPACPQRDVPVTVEWGVSCPPGHLAVLHIVHPVPLRIAARTAPSHGRVFAEVDVVVPAALPPGSLVFQAACYDPGSGRLTIGRPLSWPRN